MVNYTRMDCTIGSAAVIRAALAQAIHHAAHRRAFGALLIDHPLMQNVLADLALESEAATVLFMRVARAIDDAGIDSKAAALKRIGTALGKYYICKRGPVVVGEALECLGGNGYVEESIVPRLYREAPLNSIWEGSGNINALDVFEFCANSPNRSPPGAKKSPRPASRASRVSWNAWIGSPGHSADETQARRSSERMALLWQASLLAQHAPASVADAFIISRIEGAWGRTLGTLPRGCALRDIVDRAAPFAPVAAA